MRKIPYRMLILMTVAWLFIAGGAYAATLDPYTVFNFNSSFSLTNEDYVYMDPTVNAANVIATIGEDVDLASVINSYSNFKFTSGFEKYSTVTFSDKKILSGFGKESTMVGVIVYHYEPSTAGRIATFSSIQTIGQSGLYNEIVPLKEGVNYVLIAVKQDGIVTDKLFKVTRKTEETKVLLENMQLNFIDSTDSTKQVTEPTFNLFQSITNFFNL